MSRVDAPDLPPDVIARALDGDVAAFRELFGSYDPTVRWAVGLRLHRWPQLVPEVEDIVQEVWCELTRRDCKRMRYHEPGRGLTFRRFLAMVCTQFGWRIAKRRLGHEEEELTDVIDEDGERFEIRLMNAELTEHLVSLARKRLDPTDWRVFEGYYIRGERLKDIGAAMGMTENAVFQRHGRLLRKLRPLAEGLLGEVSVVDPPDLVAVVLAVLVVTGQGQPPPSFDPDGSSVAHGLEVHDE